MKQTLIKQPLSHAISCALLLLAAAAPVSAQVHQTEPGYLTDQRGVVARSGFDLCWRAGSDPTPEQRQQCEPQPPAPAPLAVVAEPEPPAPPPAAAPTPPPPPPMPARVTRRITLDADTLFDFDKATLRPGGRAALDQLVVSIRDMTPETVTAIGHADRFGSAAYNQRLSERRAQTVKSYLVSQNIDANRIQAEGRGETQPLTKPGECRGRKSAKVIACLQPDRRVDVEVVGSRTE